jgi:hypothetical protein
VKVDVDWTHGAGHMQASHQVTPEEADEAVTDIDAVWFDPDPHSKSGRSVRVIGDSHSRNKILTVILVHREDGGYWVPTAGSPAPQTGGGMRGASDGREAGGGDRAG